MLIAVYRLDILGHPHPHGKRCGVEQLVEEAVVLGYDRLTALAALPVYRRTNFPPSAITSVERIDTEMLAEFTEEFSSLVNDPMSPCFMDQASAIARRAYYLSYLHVLQVVLYHRGQSQQNPRKLCLRSRSTR